jgi:hypothetical protein
MRCQSCGSINEPGFRFCGSCGARQLEVVTGGAPARLGPASVAMTSADSFVSPPRRRGPLLLLLAVDAALVVAGVLLLRAGLSGSATVESPARSEAPRGAIGAARNKGEAKGEDEREIRTDLAPEPAAAIPTVAPAELASTPASPPTVSPPSSDGEPRAAPPLADTSPADEADERANRPVPPTRQSIPTARPARIQSRSPTTDSRTWSTANSDAARADLMNAISRSSAPRQQRELRSPSRSEFSPMAR